MPFSTTCDGSMRNVLHLQRHARVAGQRGLVVHQEVPVQRGERAGAVARALGGVVAAALAVRAHALDVLAGGHRGFAGHQAAVGVLAHAQRVRQLHPLDGIDVDRQVPGMHLLRLHAEHQREQAGDHQPLDVVGVAVPQRLPDRVAQAGHVGVASPVPARQVLVRVQRIEFGIGGHARPVDAAHVLAPAEDLAHEAFHAGQRCGARAVCGHGGVDHPAGPQQLQVQRCAQVRVVQPGLARPHRVLVAAEQGQSLADESLQRHERLCPRHRPGEVVQPAGVRGEARFDQRDHLARDGIGLEHRTRGVEAVERGGVQVELVAQHEHQVAQLRHGRPWRAGRRRSSTSPRSRCAPSGAASSSAGRRPRTACWAVPTCCRGRRGRGATSAIGHGADERPAC